MERRAFIAGITIGLLAAPVAGGAQPGAKLWRIGYLDQGSEANNRRYVDGLRQGLGDLGWVEGRTMVIESRFAEGKTDRLPRLAAELVRSKVDVIVTSTTPAALAAKHATTTVPIVIGFVADPVGSGIVASLARPGGNITGWTHSGRELRAKYLELLKDAVPSATRFGVLWNPANQVINRRCRTSKAPPGNSRWSCTWPARGAQGSSSARVGADGEAHPGPRRIPRRHVPIPDIADRRACGATPAPRRVRSQGIRGGRRPDGLWGQRGHNAPGPRASLGGQDSQGGQAGDLPVAQPTKFDLLINLKTAKALGLTIPPSLLARADQVIE